jgi:hypothetical protein
MKKNRRLEADDSSKISPVRALDVITDKFAGLKFDGISVNTFIIVTITASLEHYPSVAPVSFDFKTFFVKACPL